MIISVEIACWQTGHTLIMIMACCLFMIMAVHVIAKNEPQYNKVFSFGFILICVAIASLLLDFHIVDVAMMEIDGLFSEGRAMLFALMLGAWCIIILSAANYFVRRWDIITDDNDVIQLFITMVPILCTIAIVILLNNKAGEDIQVSMMREFIFGIIPGLSVLAALLGGAVRRIID